MRTLCDVCEAAPARLFCAADEAALCLKCDEKVHSCNKLAYRHVRLELAESRPVPRCDICENAPAFFFCGVDGTSLCLQCDMDVHVGGKKAHERYLMMRQRVELPSRKLRFEDTVDTEKPTAEPNSVPADKNGTLLPDQHHHHHYHHHHHHHHHEDELRAGLPASKPSCDRDNSNAPAIAIAAGDEESLLLDDCLVQNQSRMIDLNSRPKRLQNQASVPDKG
ncbi:B-box zinc finger protein 19 [Physcomitrium patens]|uniref:B box-type domain-containing protein n=1 Tax=Physcomitrium patens TaxID=3218 RepID=A9RVR6_PHYPA|nr:B-box zinc finger protein 18-like [Physcomitrium patens]XP_024387803.1 B-box zinc finger protein 18-like [Physcomitrium patens]PNR45524.1 hypothetical protein PHYPA_015295 [Physcomitrium patens]|eukprot:XP_024387802.1 B-box zinc finger protein 18-like [Physcomitrella patens]